MESPEPGKKNYWRVWLPHRQSPFGGNHSRRSEEVAKGWRRKGQEPVWPFSKSCRTAGKNQKVPAGQHSVFGWGKLAVRRVHLFRHSRRLRDGETLLEVQDLHSQQGNQLWSMVVRSNQSVRRAGGNCEGPKRGNLPGRCEVPVASDVHAGRCDIEW